MNANELANGIESCTTDPLHKQAATMLRKQQTEIESLKELLEAFREENKIYEEMLRKAQEK